jgi:hypothetical protein
MALKVGNIIRNKDLVTCPSSVIISGKKNAQYLEPLAEDNS